mmetsp:Transcript_80840/g.152796  ORF Transcript_80840/g.152796 Transcript_80840/m.152796 type:complete len:529 (-) Transcript_80840:115-1701(-)
MRLLLIPVSILFLQPPQSKGSLQGSFCQDDAQGLSEVTGVACNAPQSGRQLLQGIAEKQMVPAFPVQEDLIRSDTAGPSGQRKGEVIVPATPSKGKVKNVSMLLSLSTGIAMPGAPLKASHAATRAAQELAAPDLAASQNQASSASKSDYLFQKLNLLRKRLKVARGAEVIVGVVVIAILVISLLITCLPFSKRGSLLGFDDRDAYSSDSDTFGTAPRYKRNLPGDTKRSRSPMLSPRHLPMNAKKALSRENSLILSRENSLRNAMQPSRPRQGSPIMQSRQRGPQYYERPASDPEPFSRPAEMRPAPVQQPPDDRVAEEGKPPPSVRFLSSSSHLCPGLVVPKGNECTLVVPRIRHVNVPFFVQDVRGNPVIQADLLGSLSPRATESGVSNNAIVVLRSASMESGASSSLAPLLAYVKPSTEVGGRKGAYIYDTDDEIFAHISKSGFNACYVLTSSRSGLQAIYSGNLGGHQMTIANDAGKILATTEPYRSQFYRSGDYYKVTVNSQVDVGLILCGLLTAEYMETSR